VVSESLATLGCSVVGPFSRCSDAMLALDADAVDAAILDVNLDGEMVYPLAAMLEDRGVPFIFVTGYGVESIDRRFTHIPVIQKPVERHVLQRIFVPGQDEGKRARPRRNGKSAVQASAG
jgi:two-component SAPR family response regulator